jgi:hypothetical protein
MDISQLSLVRDCISGSTGIQLSVYGENGNVILPLTAGNKVTTFIRASNKGKDDYQAFKSKSVESVRLRYLRLTSVAADLVSTEGGKVIHDEKKLGRLLMEII